MVGPTINTFLFSPLKYIALILTFVIPLSNSTGMFAVVVHPMVNVVGRLRKLQRLMRL